MKKIITICITLALAMALPVSVHANSAIEIIEQEFQNISVTANRSRIHVTGANNMVLEIYNVAGVRVMSIRVEGNDKYYDLNLPKGCYIVKVGKVVRKISIQ